jgi:hypothetical protein
MPGDRRFASPVSPRNGGGRVPGSGSGWGDAATLPDPLPDFIEAAARLASAAVAKGERAEARRLLGAALRAVEDVGTDAQVLSIVRRGV